MRPRHLHTCSASGTAAMAMACSTGATTACGPRGRVLLHMWDGGRARKDGGRGKQAVRGEVWREKRQRRTGQTGSGRLAWIGVAACQHRGRISPAHLSRGGLEAGGEARGGQGGSRAWQGGCNAGEGEEWTTG